MTGRDQRGAERREIAVSPVPVGMTSEPGHLNEEAVAHYTVHLSGLDAVALAEWVAALTWEMADTPGHWERVEAGTRELDRRNNMNAMEN